jgi:hypothetical protein
LFSTFLCDRPAHPLFPHQTKKIDGISVMFCICEPFIGRFAAYLAQEVGKNCILLSQEREENSLPPYAAQIELAATISCMGSQASKR